MQNLEIERKYLIVLPDEEFLKSREGCVVKHITQTYLLRHENDVERRIRKIEDGKNTIYVYTEKRPKSSTTRLEDERDITEDEYNELMKERFSYLTRQGTLSRIPLILSKSTFIHTKSEETH